MRTNLIKQKAHYSDCGKIYKISGQFEALDLALAKISGQFSQNLHLRKKDQLSLNDFLTSEGMTLNKMWSLKEY